LSNASSSAVATVGVTVRHLKEAEMQLVITGKNMHVAERTEEFVREKLERLNRHLNEPVEARVELSQQNTRNADQRHIVQVTLHKNGTMIRAEERSSDLKVAVDAVVDKLDKQIRRYKDKQVRKRRNHATAEAVMEAAAESELESEPHVVRTKRFRTMPLTTEEAIEQMELLGHSFYLYKNDVTEELNVLYRREDGNYGVLEPQTA
jgi:putative sigma-54 modulation protein